MMGEHGEWSSVLAREARGTEVTLYDLWDALIDRVPWPTEGERDQWKALVQKHRDINLYGYLATKITEQKK